MKKGILGAFLFVLLFDAVAVLVMLELPPLHGVLWVYALGAAFLWWHLRNDSKRRKRLALIRIRPPRGSARTIAVAVVSTLVILVGLVVWIALWIPIDALESDPMFEKLFDYQKSFLGFIAAASLIGILIPVVEEFAFRGRIQRRLERRHGAALAIAIGSLIFAAGHFGRPHWSVLLVPLTLGIANGIATILFRSVWVGVMSHGIWNMSLSVLSRSGSDEASTSPPRILGIVLSVALISLGLAGWRQVIARTGSPLRMRARRRAVRPVESSSDPPREAVA